MQIKFSLPCELGRGGMIRETQEGQKKKKKIKPFIARSFCIVN